jgi:hypothetical protein
MEETNKMKNKEMNTSNVNRTTNLNLERRSAIATRAARGTKATIAIVLASAGLLFLMLAAGVTGSSRNAPAPITGVDARSRSFVTAYGNIVQQVEYGLTPESVAATSDGGYFALALTDSPSGYGVNWVVKLSASGRPQWQREIGCATGAPGDYALGVSAQQTSDGGYILGGGVVGCGSYPQRALVEKLDAQGRVVWAYAYPAGTGDGVIWKIRQTADGGYIAVGSAASSGQLSGALILKLDAAGTVQWQRKLGPIGSTTAYFNAVQQTSDGGYVAIGEYSVLGGSYPYPVSVLVASFDPSGNIRWQKGFNNVDNRGSPNGYEHALAGLQTSDGGYLAAGNWFNTPPGPFPVEDSGGAMLLKLDSSGNIEWQKAYNGGIYCYFNGFNTTCTLITGLPYSVHQTADGGYVLAGLGQLELLDSVPQVPWLAKVDSAGNLLWQYFYYDLSPAGRTISQYFASSTPTNDGGFMALGFTEKNDPTSIGELYAVKTDSAGLIGSCDQQHDATPLHSVDPALTVLSPSLPVLTTVTPGSAVSIRARPTSVLKDDKCPAN